MPWHNLKVDAGNYLFELFLPTPSQSTLQPWADADPSLYAS
jgi:hypothetical protein